MYFQPVAIGTLLGTAFLAVAAYRDWRYMTVPNSLLGLFLLSSLPTAWASGIPLDEFVQRFAVFAATFLAVLILFARRVMGGGAGKLVAVTTLWLPAPIAIGFSIGCLGLIGALCLAGRFREARWYEFLAEKFASIVALLGIVLLAWAAWSRA